MKFRFWDPFECTAMSAERFCGSCVRGDYVDGTDEYTCQGHDLVGQDGAGDGSADPAGPAPVRPGPEPAVPGGNDGSGAGGDDLYDGAEEDGAPASHALPPAGAGVAAGDPAGPMPVAPDLDSDDYYELHPARGAIARVHVGWRLEPWNPDFLPEGVKQEDLQKIRITQKEFADGTADVVRDEWGGTPRGSRKVTRATKGAWKGTTWFFLDGAEPVPGPARRRVTGKRPPLFVTDEWEYLKQLRTDPDFQRGAAVDSLSVQGIERTQLAAAQRVCPDLRAAYVGKLAEFLGKEPREALLECQKESPEGRCCAAVSWQVRDDQQVVV